MTSKTVATLTAFPLRAWNGHHTIVVHDRREFAALYPTIFNAPLHKSIAAARVENSFANWQGVMWGQRPLLGAQRRRGATAHRGDQRAGLGPVAPRKCSATDRIFA